MSVSLCYTINNINTHINYIYHLTYTLKEITKFLTHLIVELVLFTKIKYRDTAMLWYHAAYELERESESENKRLDIAIGLRRGM